MSKSFWTVKSAESSVTIFSVISISSTSFSSSFSSDSLTSLPSTSSTISVFLSLMSVNELLCLSLLDSSSEPLKSSVSLASCSNTSSSVNSIKLESVEALFNSISILTKFLDILVGSSLPDLFSSDLRHLSNWPKE